MFIRKLEKQSRTISFHGSIMACQHQGILRSEMVTAFKIPSDFHSARALTQQHLTPLEPGTSPTHKTHFVLTFIPHIISEIPPTCHPVSKNRDLPTSLGLISRCPLESYRSISSVSKGWSPIQRVWSSQSETTTGSLE